MSTKILIIGNSGFLGSFLTSKLKMNGLVISSIGRAQFDLNKFKSDDFDQYLKTSAFDYAIICSAITDVEMCFKNQNESQQINVNGTIQLLDVLQKNQVKPIFFSSDYVFKPDKFIYKEDDERVPETVYGQQKFTVEKYLETNFQRFLIYRTSKLMSKTNHSKNIILPIIKNLSSNQEAKYFQDQWLNPIFIEDICEVIKLSCRHELNGVFHLGTREIFTRYELANFLAKSFGFNLELIKPSSLKDILFSEKRPNYNTLNCEKIEKALNFQFTEIKDSIKDLKFLV